MRIILKSIKLLNFKGVRDLNINFNEEGVTSICGKNAIGKTTIFDAFTWLMNNETRYNHYTLFCNP